MRSATSFVSFNLMLHHCGMLEFSCSGDLMSWRGGRQDKKNKNNKQIVRCRLDRALGNEDWHILYPQSKVEYMAMIGSNHRPVLATCEVALIRAKRQFRFDKRWVGKEGLIEAIDFGWNKTYNFRTPVFVDKIKNCRNSISWWRKNNVPSGQANISSLKLALEEAKKDDQVPQEEIALLQKS